MAPSESIIRVHLFKDSEAPILALLDAQGIAYASRPPPVGVIMASGDWVEILKTATIAAPLAAVVVAFLKHRHGRKVIITCEDRTIVHAENLTHEELVMVLERAQSVTAIDTGKGPKPIATKPVAPRDACDSED